MLFQIGYYVLYEIMEDKTSLLARLYRASLYAFVAFGGAIHIICCYLLTGMKKALGTGTAPDDNILTVILQEQGGYIVPCFVVFFLFYFINVVTMALIIAKKPRRSGYLYCLDDCSVQEEQQGCLSSFSREKLF